MLDTYIDSMLKNQYLKDIGLYTEKHTVYVETDQR